MDDEAISNFERLFRSSATAGEREQLTHVQHTLGLRDNDALWIVILALLYFESLYVEYPKAIGRAAADVMDEVKKTSDRVIRASTESAKADLAKAVASVAREVARDPTRRQMTQWLVTGMFVGAGLFGLGIFIGSRL